MGDAAHATYPVGSNGATQAIIDARKLGAAFRDHGVTRAALLAYEAEMRPRAEGILRANRGKGPDAVMQTVEDRLRRDRQLTIIFVTHDLALVRNIANRVLVLDHGVVAEIGEVGQVIDHPTHPYSQQLLQNALEADLAHRAMTASDQKTAG